MRQLSSGRRAYTDDDVINAWLWFGGMPGRAARKFFAIVVAAVWSQVYR